MPGRRLVRHLALAVIVKLAALAALWWVFVRDAHVAVDPDAVAAHVGVDAHAPAATSPGARP